MKNFAKQTGTVKPNGTVTSTRGGLKFAKETGTVKPSGTNTSTKGGTKK